MKKIISLLLVSVLVVASVFALASCSKQLSGTYENITGSYVFEGDKVTYKLGALSIEGVYEIFEDEDGEMKIKFAFEGYEQYSATSSFAEGEEDGTKYIKIGVVKYTKAK